MKPRDSSHRGPYGGHISFYFGGCVSLCRGLESKFEISRDQARECMERMVKEGLLTKVSTLMCMLWGF